MNMIIEEKLEKFSQTVLREAQAQRDNILEEFDSELEAALDEYKIKLNKKSESIIKSETDKLKRLKNKLVSNAEMKSRQEINSYRNKLIDNLFESILARLNDFRLSKEYYNWLVSEIKSTISTSDSKDISIIIDNKDINLKERLQTDFDYEIALSEINLIGGFQLFLKDKKILIDKSFIANINESKKNINLF